MEKMGKMQSGIDIAQELAAKNYEKLIDYANGAQEELIHNWQVRNKKGLEQLMLISRNILNFWTDSIVKKRLWVALVRCGAWIGTLETIEKSVYEESMDMWLQKRLTKKISTIKNLPEILQLLEIKGVMTHGELTEELGLNHASTLTEIMKKIADLELITISRSGKYHLYSLTDAGIRYARQIRAGEDERAALRSIIHEYGLRMNAAELDARLRSMSDEENSVRLKRDQNLDVKLDDGKLQNVTVDNILKSVSYDNVEKPVLLLKSSKIPTKNMLVTEEPVLAPKALKAAAMEKSVNYEVGA